MGIFEKFKLGFKKSANNLASGLREIIIKKYEKLIDDNSPPFNERVINPTINKVNLSDILIIKNWLDYAEIIGDNSFEKIYSSNVSSNFLSQILKNQITFRKQQF